MSSDNAVRGLPLSTYALRGRGGIGPNADVVLRLSKRGCVNLRTRGEGGSKKPKNLRTYLMEAPLAKARGKTIAHSARRRSPRKNSQLPGSGSVPLANVVLGP